MSVPEPYSYVTVFTIANTMVYFLVRLTGVFFNLQDRPSSDVYLVVGPRHGITIRSMSSPTVTSGKPISGSGSGASAFGPAAIGGSGIGCGTAGDVQHIALAALDHVLVGAEFERTRTLEFHYVSPVRTSAKLLAPPSDSHAPSKRLHLPSPSTPSESLEV